MDDIKKLLGKRIKELRMSRNISQSELAQALDIDQRRLSAIECGVNFPTRYFVKIANYFKIDIKDLFDFKHLEVDDDEIKKEIIESINYISSRDLRILYRILHSMI